MLGRETGTVERALVKAMLTDEHVLEHHAQLLKHNRVIKHNFRYVAKCMVHCELAGCNAHYEILLVPRQILYPKYCERHRSEFQRALHLRRKA